MSIQPTFKQWLPVALMVALAAAIVVYLSTQVFASMYAWTGAVWVIFISWGMYFMAGAKVSRMHKYILGLTGGVVLGWLTILLSNVFTDLIGGALALSVTVFIAAFLILMLELTDWFELAPAYFLAYATYFAYVSGGASGDEASFFTQGIYVWVLLMAGILAGFITATLKTKIFNYTDVPLHTRNTVFDKETE